MGLGTDGWVLDSVHMAPPGIYHFCDFLLEYTILGHVRGGVRGWPGHIQHWVAHFEPKHNLEVWLSIHWSGSLSCVLAPKTVIKL